VTNSRVPEIRIQALNDLPVRSDSDYVLYWMTAQRRRRANFGLQRAVEWCQQLGKPLVVLEALRCDYQWASDRLHAFVLQGMRDNQKDFAEAGVAYLPYVEPKKGAGRGLLAALSERAAVVVADEYPCFFLPRMVAAAAAKSTTLFEQVDANGLLPLRAADKVFGRAVDFRRFLQRTLAPHLQQFPIGDPLRPDACKGARIPDAITAKWPAASDALLECDSKALAKLPIDHDVEPVASMRGGPVAGGERLRAFLAEKLARYGDRSHPAADSASGLSAHLHFGHVGVHQVFAGVAKKEEWSTAKMREKVDGARGWYGMSEAADGFLDELVTWRELGFNMDWQRADYADFESLPEWAKATMGKHAADARERTYTLAEFATASTHDPLWNAAQRQLVREGTIQNYLRMLWGKKVMEWSRTHEEAWAILVELNNRYALDGRDPNSYSGIGWVFGRYDRPWVPERPVYGVLRYMASGNTVKKLDMGDYVERFSK
jgi:deoxyribodipyrimidine photo-lyase